jgi:hypothetical protein
VLRCLTVIVSRSVPLFRRAKEQPAPAAQAVVIHLPLSDGDFGTEEERSAVLALEDRIVQRDGPASFQPTEAS